MSKDQEPAVYSHVTEQRHVKRSYDGTLASDLDVVLCERPLLWLDPTKSEKLSRIAEKHVQVKHGMQWSVWFQTGKDPRRTETASVKRNHARAG